MGFAGSLYLVSLVTEIKLGARVPADKTTGDSTSSTDNGANNGGDGSNTNTGGGSNTGGGTNSGGDGSNTGGSTWIPDLSK